MSQQPIIRVNKYVYTGANLNEDYSREVERRIQKAMSKIPKRHYLKTSIKIRLLRWYIFSVLLYGVESWTLTESLMKRVEEMWCYRRILRISWIDHVSKE